MARIRGGSFPTNKGWAYPIGAAAGSVDFEALTPQFAYDPGGFTHAANTHVDISGSGVLALLHNANSNLAQFLIQIDGGQIKRLDINGAANSPAGTIVLMLRFTTALKVTSDLAISNLCYIVYATN